LSKVSQSKSLCSAASLETTAIVDSSDEALTPESVHVTSEYVHVTPESVQVDGDKNESLLSISSSSTESEANNKYVELSEVDSDDLEFGTRFSYEVDRYSSDVEHDAGDDMSNDDKKENQSESGNDRTEEDSVESEEEYEVESEVESDDFDEDVDKGKKKSKKCAENFSLATRRLRNVLKTSRTSRKFR
jgi:hypothetical protein